MTKQGDRSVGMEILRYVIVAAAAILMIGSALGALIGMARSSATAEQALAGGLIVLTLGETLGVMLLGIAGILSLLEARVRQGRTQQRSMEILQAGIQSLHQATKASGGVSNNPAAATTTAQESSDAGRENLTQLLDELRDLMLMDDQQRREAAKRHWGRRKEMEIRTLERAVAIGDWGEVRARVDELKAIAPGDAEVVRWEERITVEQAARMDGDLAAARNQVRHSMSISAWEQAEEVVAGLQKKYPNTPQVEEIATDLQRERAAFERENIDRLFLDLAGASEHRQWKRAVQIAEELITRYPRHNRVAMLEQDLDTIRDNAATQERKEQEELFKDLLKRQRYEEAVGVARGVIEKYPNSPAATELMKLVPKVEELARAEQAKRQQVNAGG